MLGDDSDLVTLFGYILISDNIGVTSVILRLPTPRMLGSTDIEGQDPPQN